jgi:hypothetical protein
MIGKNAAMLAKGQRAHGWESFTKLREYRYINWQRGDTCYIPGEGKRRFIIAEVDVDTEQVLLYDEWGRDKRYESFHFILDKPEGTKL